MINRILKSYIFVCGYLFVYFVYLFLPCLDCYFWQYLFTVVFNVKIASNYFSIVSLSYVLRFLVELSPLTITYYNHRTLTSLCIYYNHHTLTSLCKYYKRTTELLCLIFGIGDFYENLSLHPNFFFQLEGTERIIYMNTCNYFCVHSQGM
jgi:hypothetical protein